jgi:hypothetical protein
MQKNELSLSVGICLVFFIFFAQTMAAVNFQKNLSCTGAITVINLGVFSDAACAFPILRVDWGNVLPGSINPQIIYVLNTGNIPMVLSMTYGDWSPPEAAQVISLLWNASGIVLQPRENVAARLNLQVSPNTGLLQNFTFTMTITGTQT